LSVLFLSAHLFRLVVFGLFDFQVRLVQLVAGLCGFSELAHDRGRPIG